MHWPLLHRNHPSGQDAVKYDIMNYHQWFCAYSNRINLIQMVSVIEFTRIYHHAVMQTLLNFVKIQGVRKVALQSYKLLYSFIVLSVIVFVTL